MKTKADYYHLLALTGFLGLFGLLMLWHTLIAPSPNFPVALVLIFSVSPLLLPMRGFLHTRARSCAWMAYLSLAYFIHGSTEAYVNINERLYASLEVVFSLMLFIGCTLFIRYHKQV